MQGFPVEQVLSEELLQKSKSACVALSSSPLAC